jgi:hypothetical protein
MPPESVRKQDIEKGVFFPKGRFCMKGLSAVLSAFVPALGICICGVLLNDGPILAGQSSPPAKKQQADGQDTAKKIWTIGIYTGSSLFQLSAPAGISNPVLTAADVTDLDVTIVAHPFMVVKDSSYYLFFTAKNDTISQGGIGLAESRDGLDWHYRRIVIDEPFDVSYPYVFEWQGSYYMIPEAHTEKSVRLYKATEFPSKWTYLGNILAGDDFISPTVIRYHDRWWMFVSPLGNETLRLFYASDPTGTWTEHPQSPIVKKDLNIARPAGSPVIIDGSLYRLGQDCDPTYGNQVFAFKITEISTTTYKEKMIETPIVKASSKGWNSDAMHHVDFHLTGKGKGIAVVDALGK